MQVPEKFSYLEINSSIQEALDSIFDTQENTIIIGNAGTGKSEITKIIKHVSSNDTIFLAPTGVAAVNIEGQTIHSFFRFPPSLITEKDIQPNEKTALILSRVKRIVIDEAPMVRVDILEAIDSALKLYNGTKEPFGGIQMVLIGDIFQLSPITKKDSTEERYIQDVWKDSFFFNSFAYRSANWNKIELTKVYRQKDPEFSSVLNRIRKGYQTDSDLEFINRRVMNIGKYKDIVDTEDFIYLTAFNKIVDKENRKRLSKINSREYQFEARIEGKINIRNFMIEEILEVKEGAKVMLLTNTLEWMNGDMGYIQSINGSSITIKLLDGFNVIVEPAEFTEYEYDYDKSKKEITKRIKGKITQYPIKLAYAMTVHKAQGQTFNGGYINIGKFFADHMAYVALSRFRNIEYLGISKPITMDDIVINEQAREFMKNFSKRRKRTIDKKTIV